MVTNAEQADVDVEFDAPRPDKPLPYGDVVELIETGVRGANEYLQHGYTLLGIYNRAVGRANTKGDFYVAKGPAYVLGRPAGVESWVVGQNR